MDSTVQSTICPNAPKKARIDNSMNITSSNGRSLLTDFNQASGPQTPPLRPIGSLVCPGAPLRKMHNISSRAYAIPFGFQTPPRRPIGSLVCPGAPSRQMNHELHLLMEPLEI
jgi:hypothetical protein